MARAAKRGSGFIGLAALVREIVEDMDGIESVTSGSVRKTYGPPKVKIPGRWPQRRVLPIVVSDRECGEREIIIRAEKAGAVARILGRQLAQRGVQVSA